MFVVAVAVVLVDLASAAWARASLPDGQIGRGLLRLNLVTNRGVAFGIGRAHPVAALVVSGVMVLLLAWWLVKSRHAGPVRRFGLALAVGGGSANLIDRVAHGAVTDWIHVTGYPATFNLADLAIRVGLLLVLVCLARNSRPKRARSAART